jgi:hypothetical protein
LFPFSAGISRNHHFRAIFPPRFAVRLSPTNHPQEANMQRAYDLFASLGLFSRKTAGPDLFDLRLERTRTREARREARQGLFKTRSELRAV